ncbi:hypothetical protein [Desulfobaculum sp.]
MNALLPIFLTPGEPIASPERLKAHLSAALDLLACLPLLDGILAATDSPEIKALLTARGVQVLTCAPGPDAPPFLPSGAAEAMARPAEAPWIVLDIRNRSVSEALVRSALERMRREGADVAVSAVRPDDHPCQGWTLHGEAPHAAPREASPWGSGHGGAERARFTPPGAPWEQGPGGDLRCTTTGRTISGRQQFPPVFRAEGSFAIIATGCWPSVWHAQPRLAVAAVELPAQAIAVRTPLDAVREGLVRAG